jgi:hypothetical protein
MVLHQDWRYSTVSSLAASTRTNLARRDDGFGKAEERFNTRRHLDAQGVLHNYAKPTLVPMGAFYLFRANSVLQRKYDVPNETRDTGRAPAVLKSDRRYPNADRDDDLLRVGLPYISRNRVKEGRSLEQSRRPRLSTRPKQLRNSTRSRRAPCVETRRI